MSRASLTPSWWPMQEWVKASGRRSCVASRERDTAGKGGTIKAITERVSPRVCLLVVARA